MDSYPLPQVVRECEKCYEHLRADGWALAHSFASVGIEEGKRPFEMAELYFEDFHQRGHRQERV